MSDVNVLVVFYSRYGTAERMALAAGVGAIQARANIRLRRVADHADAKTIDATPAWRENLDRMNRDYVAPRPADPQWADVIVLATPADSCVEIESFCTSLPAITSMTGKIAAPLAPGDEESVLRPIYAAAACAGLFVIPAKTDSGDPITAAREFGQRVTEIARSLKKPANAWAVSHRLQRASLCACGRVRPTNGRAGSACRPLTRALRLQSSQPSHPLLAYGLTLVQRDEFSRGHDDRDAPPGSS